MARPRKEGMDYFPHDVNLASDKKVEALRIIHGNDGYAFFCIMLELIYQENNFELNVSDAETIQILAKKTEVTPQKLQEMILTSIKHGCFDRERYENDRVLTSNGIKKRASMVVDKREKTRKTYVTSQAQVSDVVSAAEMGEESTQSKSKSKRKVKEKVIKTYTTEFDEFWNVYPRKIGKVECFKTWEKVIKNGEQSSLIIQCADNYAKDCLNKNTEERFIKHPKTFLNDERYKDYKIIALGGGGGAYGTSHSGGIQQYSEPEEDWSKFVFKG
jgi:hypothetical protein